MNTPTARLILKQGREKPVIQGHPWIFSGTIHRLEGTAEPGDIVDITDAHGRFLARAHYNPTSQIVGRILTWNSHEPLDDDFWRRKIQRALHGRTTLPLEPATTAYRLINAEADGLPGLIVDKYGDFLVIQCLTLGIDRQKALLTHLLVELCPPTGIVERSDAAVRAKEGLPIAVGTLWGTPPPPHLTITEHGHPFTVNLLTGHKTGFYLDQRDNRQLVCQPQFVAGREILNVFAYTGGFAVYAAAHAAGPITNIDSSVEILTQAEANVQANAPTAQTMNIWPGMPLPCCANIGITAVPSTSSSSTHPNSPTANAT